ncbi:MAG: Gfo/Idh/MocA family oxidoreductase [Acutalibacter sp.]
MEKVRIAMIGVGAISGIYLQNITKVFREVDLVGVCDLIPERAQKGAGYVEEQIKEGAAVRQPKIYKDMYEAFNDPEVEVILNLTRPHEHYEVTKQGLLHGKHVYSEKPLAVDMIEAKELVALAEEKGLRLGGAPDTFMGAGIQTARRVIDQGLIGDVVGASCAMVCHGHETWHPDPEFYYKRGGGPMMDMGPYYVTALVQLLGPAKGVMGMTKRTFPHRTITSQPHYGEDISVDVDTYLSGNILFENGAIAQIFTTFDVYYGRGAQARFEVYGTQGTLVVPDPTPWRPCAAAAPRGPGSRPRHRPCLERKRCPPSTTGTRKSPAVRLQRKQPGPGPGGHVQGPAHRPRPPRQLPAAAPRAGDYDQLLQVLPAGRVHRLGVGLHPHRPHEEQPHARRAGRLSRVSIQNLHSKL